MAELIEFTRTWDDLSTDKGYQFKFYCDKCHSGYMSEFVTSKLGMLSSGLNVLGGLFGSRAGNAENAAYEIQRTVGGKAHDGALRDAVEAVKPNFRKCSRCGQWVCHESCWNESRGLCENCAPDVEEEIAHAQSAATVEQINVKVRDQDMTADLNLTTSVSVRCRSCGAEVGGGKFCPNCGQALNAKTECPRCGAQAAPGAKFCAECGTGLA
jgi:hypothetical protein